MTFAHPRRDFTPGMSARFGKPTMKPDKLVKYSPKWQWSRLFNFPFRGSHWRPRMHSVVIAVDGCCKDNHQSKGPKVAGWGVFFGRDCPHNKFGRLLGETQTNNRAELEAVRQALSSVQKMDVEGAFETFNFIEVIIMTDSTYIHDTFDRWIWNYLTNGYVKENGQPAKNVDLIGDIQHLICELEYWGRAVRFWRVDREWIEEADALANRALDEDVARE